MATQSESSFPLKPEYKSLNLPDIPWAPKYVAGSQPLEGDESCSAPSEPSEDECAEISHEKSFDERVTEYRKACNWEFSSNELYTQIKNLSPPEFERFEGYAETISLCEQLLRKSRTKSETIISDSKASTKRKRQPKKNVLKKKKPARLKKYINPYAYFTAINRGKLMKENPGMDWKEISVLISERWRAMSHRAMVECRLQMEETNLKLLEEFKAANQTTYS